MGKLETMKADAVAAFAKSPTDGLLVIAKSGHDLLHDFEKEVRSARGNDTELKAATDRFLATAQAALASVAGAGLTNP